jgi:hypothetical protein
MTKKKDEVAVEAKKPDLVAVEMTEAEKAEFVAFKAKKEKDAEKAQPEDQIEVHLNFGHNVNGVSYGPGKVIVTEGLGYGLLERDEACKKSRLRVHESNEFMIQILGQGNSIVRKIKKDGI